MKEKEEEYFNSISVLSDFNTRTGILASQATVLNSAVYSPGLVSSAGILIDEYNSFSPVARMLPTLDSSLQSHATFIARDANLAISGLVANENVLGLAAMVVSQPLSWLNGIDSIHSVSPIAGIAHTLNQSVQAVGSAVTIQAENVVRLSSPFTHGLNASLLGIESNFSRLSATSFLAESALSAFKWNEFGSQIGIDNTARATLGDSFIAVSESYAEVFRSVQAAPQTIIDLNPYVIRRSPIEYYTGAELCRAISAPERANAEKQLITNKILIDNKFGLENRLPLIDPDLVRLWNGANESLASANPDKVRHFATSVRELVTQVIHALSPDDEVKQWTSDENHFKDGRPTREARLLYISRDINLGSFTKFVQKDVSATIEFINLFQLATHKVKSSFTEKQLLALKAKAESTLNFLIEIGLPDA